MSIFQKNKKTDFLNGPVWRRIVAQAIPLTVAQLVHLLYNVVDRIYLGHMDGADGMALTGIGLTLPIVTLIMAFTALFGNGGVPLFSIAGGEGDKKNAASILGNSFALLITGSLVLTVLGYLMMKPLLFAFGASEASFIYAKKYLDVYLLGTVFSMIGTGMNGYISAQGFPRVAMYSISLGALCNIALDPIFIFGLDMGISGAATATVISQAASALLVTLFLIRKENPIPLSLKSIALRKDTTAAICKLGTASFIAHGTNCLVQVACTSTLQAFGGDAYISIMTVVNSVRDIFSLPITGITDGAQPVISYNYGAKEHGRVRSGIRFCTLVGTLYTLIAWLLVIIIPSFWFGIFSNDPSLTANGIKALQIYFFGFVFMSLQFAGQSTFQALGDAKHAIFFSLLRKAVIVAPLTLLLPRLGLGVMGVFMAEPISNIIGGSACYLTMRMTVYKRIKRAIREGGH